MEALWIIGGLGLLVITGIHAMFHKSAYTLVEQEWYAEHNRKVLKSFKITATIWFIIWLVPPLVTTWIEAVLH